jgi:hypothetical protein
MILRMLSLCGCCITLLQVSAGVPQPDHLLPVNPAESPSYRAFLKDRLEKTPFDHGRIILRPNSDSEVSISIHRGRLKAGSASYVMTCIEANASLWDASKGGDLLDRARSIGTHRIDRFIPDGLAEQLKTALTGMLRETRFPEADERPKRVIIEGPILEFSVPQGNEVLRGEISALPPTGPKLSRLKRLTFDLLAYCKLAETSGQSAEMKIERTAKALIKLTNATKEN